MSWLLVVLIASSILFTAHGNDDAAQTRKILDATQVEAQACRQYRHELETLLPERETQAPIEAARLHALLQALSVEKGEAPAFRRFVSHLHGKGTELKAPDLARLFFEAKACEALLPEYRAISTLLKERAKLSDSDQKRLGEHVAKHLRVRSAMPSTFMEHSINLDLLQKAKQAGYLSGTPTKRLERLQATSKAALAKLRHRGQPSTFTTREAFEKLPLARQQAEVEHLILELQLTDELRRELHQLLG